MYYEKVILPIDTEGNFLFAILYPRYKIGGEITRESTHAYFAYGNVNHPDALKDITHLCCLPRKSSSREMDFYSNIAKSQHALIEQYHGSKTLQKQYQNNAWQYTYQAMLAQKDSRYVPRSVRTSLNGILAVGVELEEVADASSGHLRFIDIFAEKIIADHHESKPPKAQAICYPHAISVDGKSLIITEQSGFFGNKGIVFIEKSIPKMKSGASIDKPMPVATFCVAPGMWIAIDENVYLIESGTGKVMDTLPLPKGVYGWTAQIALEKQIMAFAGDKGQISLLDLTNGKVKNYFPHRGCKRDDFAEIRLSVSGDWMVSKIRRRKDAMITRLADGISWLVAELNDEVIDEKVEGEFRSQSHIPAAFGFIGSRLLVSDSQKFVRELAIAEPQNSDRMFVSEQGKPGARVPIAVSPKATFGKIIKAAHLERLGDEISRYYSPAVKLKTKKAKKSGWLMPGKKGAPDLAVSRIGGWPDLPKGTAWPMWQGRPMSFLAQINLAEVHAVRPDIRLPGQGLLLFFLGCTEDSYYNENGQRETYMVDPMLGIETVHKDAWKVIYAESSTPLTRTKYENLPSPDMFAPCLLGLSSGGLTLPDENTAAYENIPFNQTERDNFNEVIDLISSNDGENQLMGYPNLIQFTPPDMQCELAASGKDPSRFPPEGSDEYGNLIIAASDWCLLLQLTSDDSPGFMWGDAGHLYFYGKCPEMEKGNVSNIWVNYECH